MIAEMWQKELCDIGKYFYSIKINLYSIYYIYMISKYIFIQSKFLFNKMYYVISKYVFIQSKEICIQKKIFLLHIFFSSDQNIFVLHEFFIRYISSDHIRSYIFICKSQYVNWKAVQCCKKAAKKDTEY